MSVIVTPQQLQCDLCGGIFPADGTVQKVRLSVQGPIVRFRQPLGDKPDAIEASQIDHTQDLGVEDACEACREALREAIQTLQTERRKQANG